MVALGMCVEVLHVFTCFILKTLPKEDKINWNYFEEVYI